jgi:hypothetical protein
MIGSNTSLGSGRPGAFSLGAQSSIQKPRYISDDATEGAVNNVLAQGIAQGDQRFQAKQVDKQGFSRGRGQAFMAAQSGQQAISQAASQAAGLRAEDQMRNANMQSDYENQRERQGMATAMNTWERSQADWSVASARRQAQAQLFLNSLMR